MPFQNRRKHSQQGRLLGKPEQSLPRPNRHSLHTELKWKSNRSGKERRWTLNLDPRAVRILVPRFLNFNNRVSVLIGLLCFTIFFSWNCSAKENRIARGFKPVGWLDRISIERRRAPKQGLYRMLAVRPIIFTLNKATWSSLLFMWTTSLSVWTFFSRFLVKDGTGLC